MQIIFNNFFFVLGYCDGNARPIRVFHQTNSHLLSGELSG